MVALAATASTGSRARPNSPALGWPLPATGARAADRRDPAARPSPVVDHLAIQRGPSSWVMHLPGLPSLPLVQSRLPPQLVASRGPSTAKNDVGYCDIMRQARQRIAAAGARARCRPARGGATCRTAVRGRRAKFLALADRRERTAAMLPYRQIDRGRHAETPLAVNRMVCFL